MNVVDQKLESEIKDLEQQKEAADRWIRALAGELADAQKRLGFAVGAIDFAVDLLKSMTSVTQVQTAQSAASAGVTVLERSLKSIDPRQ